MQKINFQNLPSTTTPINATNLNALQDNVEDVFNGTEPMGNIVVSSISGQGQSGTTYISGNLNVGGVIENKSMGSTNLNDIKITGIYTYDNGSQGYTNCPTQDGIHILNVINNGGLDWLIQEDYVLRYGAGSTEKYIRQYTPGGWGNWQKII